MSLLTAIAAALALVAQAEDEQVKVVGRPWAPFVSPMGEPFRARAADDRPIVRWFQQADSNRDGLLSLDEMLADALRFFRTLDESQDGEIDPEELVIYESDIAPEVQVNSRWKRTQGAAAMTEKPRDGAPRWKYESDVDGYQLHGLQGAARYGLLNIPQPVAGADADFDRGISLDEFQRAAVQRFQLLDGKGTGNLTLAELEARLPTRPAGGKKTKRPKDAVDTRVGQPFPAGD